MQETVTILIQENEDKKQKLTESTNESIEDIESIDFDNNKDKSDFNEQVERSEDDESEDEDCINIEVFNSESGGETEKKNLKFSCSMCSFQSQRKSHFMKHTALHQTMTTIYRCDECSFSTLRFTHLRRHQVTHSIKPLACSSCSYSTDDSKLLARHTRLQHKV